MIDLPITPDLIRRTHARIAPHVRRTPVWTLPGGVFGHEGNVSLKLELFQCSGSFKARGAFSTLLSLPERPRAVAAASGGNHGAAVAYAARELSLPARIFVPEISSPAKIALIRSFGADLVIGGARYADAQEACDAYVRESGAQRIHPFDAVTTVAGAGTVALEWSEAETLDTVLIACGGGGLVAGAGAFWQRSVRVVGVEPEGSCALHAALASGGPVDVPVESVAKDSLGARSTSDLIYAIACETIDRVVLVEDAAILRAQRFLWQHFRLAVEPGGAAALAALLSRAYQPERGERVGILLCGANTDLGDLAVTVSG